MNLIHFLLMKTHLMLHHRVDTRIGPLGLTPGQPKILDYLQHHGEADQSTIAAACRINKVTLGSLIERMERQGLVKRERHENNRRSWFVTLTPEGEDKAAKLAPIFHEVDAPIEQALTAKEQEQLIMLLRKVSDALEQAGRD